MCNECDRVRREYPPSKPCDCNECRSMCQRPCWALPDEADAINAATGGKLMEDWWEPEHNSPPVDLLSAPCVGYEGARAPSFPNQSCAFLKDGLCSIHKIKPHEGKAARHDAHKGGLHRAIARAWWIHGGGDPKQFEEAK